ncbi:MAG: hypothetical protein M1823_008580, partial [Watsoniomyces obsoletus]
MKKIKMAERRYAEANHSHSKKTKKRMSGGSNLNTPNANSASKAGHVTSPLNGPATAHGSPSPNELATQKSKSRVSQQTARPQYTTAATQTDPEEGEMETPPPKRRKFITPTQRLLRKVFADRARHEQQCKMGLSSPGPLLASRAIGDVEMKDAGAGLSP